MLYNFGKTNTDYNFIFISTGFWFFMAFLWFRWPQVRQTIFLIPETSVFFSSCQKYNLVNYYTLLSSPLTCFELQNKNGKSNRNNTLGSVSIYKKQSYKVEKGSKNIA